MRNAPSGMPKPSVSVIIPTYNRAALLKEAIDSVVAQTFSEWELIVVDDGSTDQTVELLASVGDDRVRSIRQENLGVASARNCGVASSSGEFIAFLDSDDLWLPGKLEAQLDYFESNPHVLICQTEEIWVRRGERVNPMRKHRKRSGWIFEACLPRCIVSPSAVMMKRSIFDQLGGFDESFPACEDYDLWLRAALRFEIHTLPQAQIVKRGGHADQLSNRWGLDIHRIAALEKILGDPALPVEMKPLIIREIERRSGIVADGALKRGNLDMWKEFDAKRTLP